MFVAMGVADTKSVWIASETGKYIDIEVKKFEVQVEVNMFPNIWFNETQNVTLYKAKSRKYQGVF